MSLKLNMSIAYIFLLGPSILEVFDTLLKHLKLSVDFMGTKPLPEVSNFLKLSNFTKSTDLVFQEC